MPRYEEGILEPMEDVNQHVTKRAPAILVNDDIILEKEKKGTYRRAKETTNTTVLAEHRQISRQIEKKLPREMRN